MKTTLSVPAWLALGVTLAVLAVGFAAGATWNNRDAISQVNEPSLTGLSGAADVADLPCGADLAFLLDEGIQPVYALGVGESPRAAIYVLSVDDFTSATDLQKLLFESCGGSANVSDRWGLGDIAWQRAVAGGMTEFGTLAIRSEPSAVALTVQMDCSEHSCLDVDSIYRSLSAVAYLWAELDRG